MCTGSFAKCLGITLMPLAIVSVLCNILLLFPGGVPASENDHITTEAWYFGGIFGSGVLMIFPALVFLGLKNNDCCGCCGNESCGKRFASFTSIIFAGVGVLGAGYCFIISVFAINRGPICLFETTFANSTTNQTWGYPPTFEGNYLSDHSLWKDCVEPHGIVTWHLTLFSILLIMGLLQAVLCAIQVINGLIGFICGDCCGCCGSDGAV